MQRKLCQLKPAQSLPSRQSGQFRETCYQVPRVQRFFLVCCQPSHLLGRSGQNCCCLARWLLGPRLACLPHCCCWGNCPPAAFSSLAFDFSGNYTLTLEDFCVSHVPTKVKRSQQFLNQAKNKRSFMVLSSAYYPFGFYLWCGSLSPLWGAISEQETITVKPVMCSKSGKEV